MNKFVVKIILISVFLTFFSCGKDEEFSIIPEIEFVSFKKLPVNGIDYRGVLKFSFKDRDGDIGLTEADTVEPYKYNLFIHYYEKQNGEFVDYEFPDTVTPPHGRIPDIRPEGQNKTIKGTIEDTIFINDFDLSETYDTLKLDVYILDRALHKSNVITTPEIIVKKKND
jgi:hypothetical protein